VTRVSVTDLPPVLDGIEAVCFDAFGTLVEITDKRQAFRPLFKALSSEKRRELTTERVVERCTRTPPSG